jgi:hypothetical protein
LTVAIGPIEKPSSELTALPPAKGVAEFVEGLLKAFGDENHLDKTEECV